MRLAMAMIALTLAARAGASAADLNNAALTFSPGSCNEYLNARRENRITLFKGWISGWISAHDRLMPETYALVIDDEQMVGPLKFMEDWCTLHPLRDFVDGAGELIDELYPKRQQQAPP